MKELFMKKFLASSLSSLAFVTLLGACGTADQDSASKITNGKVIQAADYPSVVLLYDQKLGALCTGTFINETTVISAAHCTDSGRVDAVGNVTGSLLLINVNSSGEAELVATSTSMVRNIKWDQAGKNVNQYDLSLITFPVGTAKAVSQLASVTPKRGASFTIVGFGLNQSKNLNDGSSAGIKRTGTNVVSSISGGFIQFTGQSTTTTANGTNSSASAGDSGGPLFVDGKLAGITSGGGQAGIFSSNTQSLYVDINSSSSKAFLSKFLK
jgi:secreted trypsin-like serine protease